MVHTGWVEGSQHTIIFFMTAECLQVILSKIHAEELWAALFLNFALRKQ